MFCTYCSQENPDYAGFCTNCGRRLEKETYTPAVGIIPLAGERMSNGQAPAGQEAALRESFPAGRDSDPYANLPTLLPHLPPASLPSPGEQSPVAVLDRVSSPIQQPLNEQPNAPAPLFPSQQAQPWERFGQPSDQQSSSSDRTLRAVPYQNVAVLPIQTSGNSPLTSPGIPPGASPPKKGLRDKLPKKWRIFALIALIILLVGGSASFLIPWLHTTLSAATATVTITPASQHLTKTYAINAVTGTPLASEHQVQARLLSFTTQAQSKTVKATGQGHQEATQAKGKVTISPQNGTIPAGNRYITSNSGVEIGFTVTQPISAGSWTFDAWADKAGQGGNIPAYDVDGSYYSVTGTSISYYVQNTQAFTGGQDAHNYTFVQQSDIDGATAPLVSQLTSDAQAPVQKQLGTNEQFAATPQCTRNVKANHKADDRATSVTVTVTCKGEAYNEQAARSMAADWFRSDANSQPGAHYALVGDLMIGTPQVGTTDEHGTVTLNVSAEGIWVYQFSASEKQQIARLIAGKPLADAQALLQKQTGVKKADVGTADGWGTALPTSASDIKFTMVSVPGLKATPTS